MGGGAGRCRHLLRGPALALMLAVGACSASDAGPTSDAATPPPPVPAPPAASDPDPDAATGVTPDSTPAPAPAVPAPCDPATEAAVAAPVAAQLDAFAAGDFAAAHAQASAYFRTVVPLDRFEALIRSGYPEVLDVSARRLAGCTVLNRRAILVVDLTTSTGAGRSLAYRVSDTDEGWRIDGADDAAPPRPAPEPPQV